MRYAVVTGCSSGIGEAVARDLLVDGWRVTGFSRRRPDRLQHERFSWRPLDVSKAITVKPWWFQHGLDALVHCAAEYGPIGPLHEVEPQQWARCIETNLTGTHRVLHALLPYLLMRDDARVLLLSGGGAFNARPMYSAYAASKAGVVSIMENVAEEQRGHVAVNCLAPGFVPTAIHAATLAAGASAGLAEYNQVRDASMGDDPMPRVLECVRVLLGPRAAGLTGKTISVPHDDWASINERTVPVLMAGQMGQRDRHKIARLAAFAAHPTAAMV